MCCFNMKNIILKPINKNLIDILWSQKPKNLILIYSNSKLNNPIKKLPKYFNKTFNNVTKDQVNNFIINCYSKCVDCLLC